VRADLADHADLRDLIDRYVTGVDERRFDDPWFRSIFTEDVALESPRGKVTGVSRLGAYARSLVEPWDRTLHHTSNHLIDVDGDRANLQATLYATHLHRPEDPGAPFHIGGRFTGEAMRTADGWRLRRLHLELIWTEGDPPSSS
jgi:hypothetical protein